MITNFHDSDTRLTPESRVAVVGAGIAGMAAAWLLKDHCQVVLLESAALPGGHANTVEVDNDGELLTVDTGFMVFNDRNYPSLRQLFSRLGVGEQPTDMSFSVSIDQGRREWSGSSLRGLFAQQSNLLSLEFGRMLVDILRFNREAKAYLATERQWNLRESLDHWLRWHRFGETFRNEYLLPMSAAIWSSPPELMLDYPAVSLLRFFENHGLLDLRNRPQWFTVPGGSRAYVDRLIEDLRQAQGPEAVRLNARIRSVEAKPLRPVRLRFGDASELDVDHVIMATHPDQALALLDDPDVLERHVLGQIKYQGNRVYLHNDPRLMPKRKAVWSSWNYLANTAQSPRASGVSVTYWMNRLQRFDEGRGRDWFVSLNPPEPPDGKCVAREFFYEHPILDVSAAVARQSLPQIQGRRGIWYAGAYLGNGFHEDGLVAALDVVHAMGVHAPWESASDAVQDAA